MSHELIKQSILEGRAVLGMELGSTRIKAVLSGEDHLPIASGSHDWENRLEQGVWTYSLDDVWSGIQDCYAKLAREVDARYGVRIEKLGAIGISAMMHGYLVFDAEGAQLAPFRTWRNTITERAAGILTEKFQFNIPQRWSIAHLYQAVLNGESHVRDIAFMTTLAGYVHWKLTGEKVLGVGEASGMFPIDSGTGRYNERMTAQFGELVASDSFSWKLEGILPRVLSAGENAGELSAGGARLLDPSGTLLPGAPMCPPEGDAGTGMVATNSVAERTGNISAGTSVFAMIVLERELSRLYTEIDMVTTPSGRPVAMVHCNNCLSEFDAWLKLFKELTDTLGMSIDKPALYDAMYGKALEGDSDCGGLLTYNYLSGEHITGFDEGRPLLTRTPDSRFTLSNLMRSLLFSSMGTLKLGMDILTGSENVRLERMLGHGGLFKTEFVGQSLMASALGVPVAVMESAGEGGAWGIALLAAYMINKAENESLEDYLSNRVFGENAGKKAEPKEADALGFSEYMRRYKRGLEIERAAVIHLKRD